MRPRCRTKKPSRSGVGWCNLLLPLQLLKKCPTTHHPPFALDSEPESFTDILKSNPALQPRNTNLQTLNPELRTLNPILGSLLSSNGQLTNFEHFTTRICTKFISGSFNEFLISRFQIENRGIRRRCLQNSKYATIRAQVIDFVEICTRFVRWSSVHFT